MVSTCVVCSPGTYPGITLVSAISAYHGSPKGAKASWASSCREAKGGKNGSVPTANSLATPSRAPARPATNAEMQKMINLAVFVLSPIAVTAFGESDIPCNSRPSRLRWMNTTRTATSTKATSTT